MAKKKLKNIHITCMIGKTLEDKFGLENLTARYNAARRRINPTKKPVQCKTVHRYNAGGRGYDVIGVPGDYGCFLASVTYKTFSDHLDKKKKK